jgi:hypothetical protein
VAGSVAAKSTLFGLVTKIVVLSLVGAAAVGVAVGIAAHRRAADARATVVEPVKAAQHRSIEVHSMRPSAPAAAVEKGAIVDPSALPLIPTSVQAGLASSVRRADRSLATAETDASLLEQIIAIDRARASLRSGNASEALQNASDYRRKYPRGNLIPEALFLQMQASKQLGQMGVATKAARELVERFPNAPNVGRARDLLKSESPSDNP